MRFPANMAETEYNGEDYLMVGRDAEGEPLKIKLKDAIGHQFIDYIKPTDAAPTPMRNGNYTFSIGGNKPAWLTAEAGVTTVKAGDGVAVVYTAPSGYSYTHVDVYVDVYAIADYTSKLDTFSKISIFKNNASQKSVIGVSNFIINTNLRRVAGYTFGLSNIYHNVLNAGKYKTFVSFYSLDSSGTRIDQDSRYYYENDVSTVKTGIETITLVVVAGTQHITGTITVDWDVLPVGVSTINANTLSDDIFQSNELYDSTQSSIGLVDRSSKLLSDVELPVTQFELFTSNLGTGKFANLFTGRTVYGIVASCYLAGTVNFGKVNKATNVVTPINSVAVKIGLNVIKFDVKVTLATNEYIYVSGSILGVLRYVNTGDVSAWDVTANATSSGLAISYGIIKNNANSLFNIFDALSSVNVINTSISAINTALIDRTTHPNTDGYTLDTVNDRIIDTSLLSSSVVSGNYWCNGQMLHAGIIRSINVASTVTEIKAFACTISGTTITKTHDYGTINASAGVVTLSDTYIISTNEYLFIKFTGAMVYANIGASTYSSGNGTTSATDVYTTYQIINISNVVGSSPIPILSKDLLASITDLKTNYGLIDYGHFVLPSTIHAAIGIQCNLWWNTIANYIEGDKSIQFSVISTVGETNKRCFRFTPTVAGDYAVKLISKNLAGIVIDSKTVTVKVASAAAGSGNKNILMCGDSRTWQNISDIQGSATYTGGAGNKTITTELKALLDANLGASFNFVGTCISAIDATVKNEAYSGYSYAGFLTLSSVSPFWNPSTNQFDLPWYMSTKAGLSGQLLDYVTIMFGVNDITYGKWTANTETMYADMIAGIPSIVNNAKLLVQKFIDANANCKIVLIIEPTTCENQDSFGYWGKTYQSYGNTKGYELERAMKQLRKAIITTFDNGAYNSNVIISGAGLWVDRTYGFPYTTEKVSSRASVATKLSFKNSIHPHDDGYKQIADGLFGTIKSLEQ